MKKAKRIIAGVIACAIALCACGNNTAETTSGTEETSILTEEQAETTATDTSPDQTEETTTVDTTEQTEETTTAPVTETEQLTESETAEVTASSESAPEETAEETTAVTTAATTAATTTAASTTAAATTKPDKKETITVSVTVSNTWEEGGKVCTQLDGVVKNTTSKNITSWSFDVSLGNGAEINQVWNCNAKISGNSLKVSNADYNGEVAAGGETTFGGIVKTDSKFTPTVSGTNVTEGSAPAKTDSGDNGTTAPETDPDPADITVESTGKYGLVSECGQLSVKGADLVDKNGDKVQLRGISTHGIQWFPQFANKDVFKTLRDDWNVNVIRLAMYTGNGEGYNDSTKAGIEKTVEDAVDAAIELDMYVIVDWHILQDQSPQVMKKDALRFFKYMSKKYAEYPNVIYEICNEPNGYANWDGDIKPYAEEVIPVIRKNAPNAVVIVGTPTWSQDIDKALANPLDFDNVMYALHYYAATHTDWLRQRVQDCYDKGLPIFVSEFGMCDASGGGGNDFAQAKKWFNLLDKLDISYVAWAMADKNETCCLLKPGASTDGKWDDSELNESGKWLKEFLSKK